MVDFALPYLNGAFVDIIAREDAKPSTTPLNDKFSAFLSKVGF